MAARKPISKSLSADHIGDYIAQAASTVFTLENQMAEIERIASMVVRTLEAGRTILSCGNGGGGDAPRGGTHGQIQQAAAGAPGDLPVFGRIGDDLHRQ